MIKYCNGCNEHRPHGDWAKNKSKKDGLATRCKFCMDKYRQENKARLNQQRKDFYWKNPKRYREDASQSWLDSGRDKNYGLVPGTISELLKYQEFKCGNPACDNDITWNGSAVDHDHSCCPNSKSCGRCVRGLLCKQCNWALGYVGDNIDKLNGLVDYLLVYSEEI